MRSVYPFVGLWAHYKRYSSWMIGCFLIGKDTSVCVRFLTNNSDPLTHWIEKFERGPCHVHLDSAKTISSYEKEFKKWLDSSTCASALLLLDTRVEQILEPSFLHLCRKAKKQGVFIGILGERDEPTIDQIVQSYEPNWILPIKITPERIQAKVNEILGVVRFTPFTRGDNKSKKAPSAP